ncbi:hypothetical protein HLB35_12525 [Halomonas sp. TBZ9]|uniref:Uncharacterized protein n=1 Tax=Vreelandella azerica TaxID=2732867 RepID=A0A7Y3TYL8_9GAMM|nr:hypothetical protein [Halomonas azerica]NOG32373.1 hypothetical protein [Halomonas azerica]
MSISSIFTVLMYALAPFAWLIIAGVVILLAVHLLAYMRGYQITQYRCMLATGIAALIGLSAFFWAPWLTNSQFTYINTVFDWVAAIGSIIGAFVVAFLLLHPLSYLVKGQDT